MTLFFVQIIFKMFKNVYKKCWNIHLDIDLYIRINYNFIRWIQDNRKCSHIVNDKLVYYTKNRRGVIYERKIIYVYARALWC
jgi:hypothetical protein